MSWMDDAELEAHVCCATYESAARAMCGCKGTAATVLRLAREDTERETA